MQQQWGYNSAMGYNGSGSSCGGVGSSAGEVKSGGGGSDCLADLRFASMPSIMFPDQQQQQQRQFYNQDYQRGTMRQNQPQMSPDMMEPNDLTWLRFQQLQRQQQMQANALLNDSNDGGSMCFPSYCGASQSGGSPFYGNMNPMDMPMRQSLPSGDMQCGMGFDGLGSSKMFCGYVGDRNGNSCGGGCSGGMAHMPMDECCSGSNPFQQSGLLPDI